LGKIPILTNIFRWVETTNQLEYQTLLSYCLIWDAFGPSQDKPLEIFCFFQRLRIHIP